MYNKYADLEDNEINLSRAYMFAQDTEGKIDPLLSCGMKIEEIMLEDVIPGYSDLFKYEDLEVLVKNVKEVNTNFGGSWFTSSIRQYGKDIENMKSRIAEEIAEANIRIQDCKNNIRWYKSQLNNEG